ncbi:MAG: hypothetical protein IPM47_06480 [Sphingobacteriales bacterium]|nr:MAG: hypothetical protein IPM47_06480 [Sphingobacteriales bacterium]
MEFLAKTTFFLLFGISSLAMLFLLTTSVKILIAPNGKTSEAIISALSGLIFGTGLYFTYHLLQNSERYIKGCTMLGMTWLVAIFVILIGFLFFSGPLRWQ